MAGKLFQIYEALRAEDFQSEPFARALSYKGFRTNSKIRTVFAVDRKVDYHRVIVFPNERASSFEAYINFYEQVAEIFDWADSCEAPRKNLLGVSPGKINFRESYGRETVKVLQTKRTCIEHIFEEDNGRKQDSISLRVVSSEGHELIRDIELLVLGSFPKKGKTTKVRNTSRSRFGFL
ncbi:hypothetical protein D6829_01390 [Candidatus Pacearchaeota archaeon]|nr:MAG: hypothetical protein D6829_01390 [Candidatus Pacearchaeota archaeon]